MGSVSGHDPTDLQGMDEARKDAGERARRSQETEESDVRWLMSSEIGRRIAWRLMERAGVFRSTFNDRGLQMAFNEGFRNYGNALLNEIHLYCPELYTPMLKENTANGKSDKRRAK